MEIDRVEIVLNDRELGRHYYNALNNGTDYSGFWDEYYSRLAYLEEFIKYCEGK